MLLKSYKNHIVEGKRFVFFVGLFTIFIRIAYYFLSNNHDEHLFENEGYLWTLISPFFGNVLISLIVSFISLAIIVMMVYTINVKYTLIRRKTVLPVTISLLLFNCHPSFLHMNPYYIGAICILFAISSLFGAYGSDKCQINALKVSFIISFGALFVPFLLVFIPIFWIGLVMLRSFNFGSILASFFSLLIVFLPVFTYQLLSTGDVSEFLTPYSSVSLEQLLYVPFMHYNRVQYLFSGFLMVILSIILINNYLVKFKDKIRVRSLISFLNLLAIFSLLFSLFVNVNYYIGIYVFFIAITFLLSHLFAVAESKWYIYLFELMGCVFIVFCFFTYIIL